jgi:hypothetical protein
MRIKNVFLGVMVFAMTVGLLSAQEAEGNAGGGGDITSIPLDFNASAVSVNSDGDVDSFTDSGFGEDNESTLRFSYESEFFGGVASLGFLPDFGAYFEEDFATNPPPLAIDELYAWIKPFGTHFKFTGGIFENTDGVADYTDDIDNFGMGVFYDDDDHIGPYLEPESSKTGTALVNGFLAEAAFGPITAQLHLGPNFSGKSAAPFFNDAYGNGLNIDDAEARFYRVGGRLIADIGVGTVSALVKSYSIPTLGFFPGKAINLITFGAYADITAIETLGISLGYTGFVSANDDSDIKTPLWSGIDLRATWTGIEGLSISTHNNISFAKGEDYWIPRNEDSALFFSLYNAVGATKEITEKLSVNVEIGNIFSTTNYAFDYDADQDGSNESTRPETDYDNFWAGLKLISRLAEDTEFTVGVRVDYEKTGDETATIFSVPVGLKVSF